MWVRKCTKGVEMTPISPYRVYLKLADVNYLFEIN